METSEFFLLLLPFQLNTHKLLPLFPYHSKTTQDKTPLLFLRFGLIIISPTEGNQGSRLLG